MANLHHPMQEKILTGIAWCNKKKRIEENMPFDNNRDKELLMSFSTGFTSTGGDSVNAERAAEVGMEMQIKLDGQSGTLSMDVKSKVKALLSLRKIPTVTRIRLTLTQ